MPRVSLLGDRYESYPSHQEMDACIPLLGIEADWVPTDAGADLSGYDGLWLMPGWPYQDDAAVMTAITWARPHDVPFLGTCGGLQNAVVELTRNALGVRNASHAEIDGEDDSNVVGLMACSVFGQEREVRPTVGTRFAAMVPRPFTGMHYCSCGPSSAALARLATAGWEVGATAQDVEAEVLQLTSHPFCLLSLFQPQIGSLAGKPLHPLLREFVRAVS